MKNLLTSVLYNFLEQQDSIHSITADSALNVDNKSIFYGHTLKPIHEKPIINSHSPSYWEIVILFLIFCIYVLIRIAEPKKIGKMFIAVFSMQEAKQLFRQEFRLTKRISLLLVVAFIFILAFFMQFMNKYYGFVLINSSHLLQYFFFVLVITLVVLLKFVAVYCLAFISSNIELGKEYLFNVLIFSQTIGIILFPLMTCIQFTKFPPQWFLFPSVIIYVGFYLLRAYRTMIISAVEQNIGILYIILYLCTLEILPLLVLIKFLLVNF